jgi:hypothetical protein
MSQGGKVLKGQAASNKKKGFKGNGFDEAVDVGEKIG